MLFKRRRPFLRILGYVGAITVLLLIFLLLDLTLRNSFFDIAEVRAVQLATDVMQKALQQEIAAENLQYQDFIDIHKDSQGHVALMQANTIKINRFAANTTLSTQKALEDLKMQSFTIPIGQVLGIPMLANYGPGIRYNILPVGTVRVNVADRFETAGINQTRHTIYLNFDINVRIVIPFRGGEAVVATQVPLAESIIVGSVPSTFVTVPGSILGGGQIK